LLLPKLVFLKFENHARNGPIELSDFAERKELLIDKLSSLTTTHQNIKELRIMPWKGWYKDVHGNWLEFQDVVLDSPES
jgi:hypothetical protein